MRPGRRPPAWVAIALCALLPYSVLAQPAATERPAVEAGWILERIARPAPVSTSFLEVRDSPMLKAPLRVSGEYQRPDDATLVREVQSPYRETTTIRGDQATIAREGRAPRRFKLTRAPELAALQASFGALLGGDRVALERHYTVRSQGVRERWILTMAPKDAALAARVREVALYGRGAELRCIETRPVDGEIQRTLLATAARAATPAHDGAALAALCHGEANAAAAPGGGRNG
ncbi:LolA-related protein [Luteimonas yindakuii]|uniref:LolA-related protein n=1 Tax=Luteimonas yindakuii TaxID=2565782 RepID=UPI001FB689E5|nr:LolA-related protein [Luteimonas yindakuii]